MNILKIPMTLKGIERRLEKELNQIRIIGDLDFTYDDYKYLASKIKVLVKFRSNLTDFQDYKLCLIVFWVFTLKYEDSNRMNYYNITGFIDRLPQHQVKYFLNICNDTLHEYGINTFGKDDSSLENIFSIMAIHVGIDNDFYDIFFNILNNSIYASIDSLYDEIMDNLTPHMSEIYRYINDETKNEIFFDCRGMFMNYKLDRLPEKEIMEKYPFFSRKLIEACVSWFDIQEEKEEISIS